MMYYPKVVVGRSPGIRKVSRTTLILWKRTQILETCKRPNKVNSVAVQWVSSGFWGFWKKESHQAISPLFFPLHFLQALNLTDEIGQFFSTFFPSRRAFFNLIIIKSIIQTRGFLLFYVLYIRGHTKTLLCKFPST